MTYNLSLFAKRPIALLFIGAVLMVLVSWFRAYHAGTIMVDGHGMQGLNEVLVFSLFVIGLLVFSFGYFKAYIDKSITLLEIKHISLLLAAVFTFMVPLLSNDVFSYFAFGDASNKGVDVYLNQNATQLSSYNDYLKGLWLHSVCAYGPLALMLYKVAAAIGQGQIWLTLLVYKIIVLSLAGLFIHAAYNVSLLLNGPKAHFALIVLNPVLLLQGVGQLHTDLVAIVFVMFGIYNLLRQQWWLAFIMVGLSVATKMNYIIVLPFFVVAMWLQHMPIRVYFSNLVVGLSLFVTIIMAMYAPFYTSSDTIAVPFQFHYHQNPSKCVSEILGDIVYFAPQLLHGKSDQLQTTVESSNNVNGQLYVTNVIVKICQGVALSICAYILTLFLLGAKTIAQWYKVYLRCVLLFLLYYLHIFNPWYLMMALPFATVQDDPRFIKWLMVLTCLISIQDIVCAISRDSIVYTIELVLTFISVMAYLYRPRMLFIQSLQVPTISSWAKD